MSEQEAMEAARRIVEWYDAHPVDGDKEDDTYVVARALLASEARRAGEEVLVEADPLAQVPSSALEIIIQRVLGDACELPDRSSPEDQPEMMLITGDELDMLLRRHLGLEDRELSAHRSKTEPRKDPQPERPDLDFGYKLGRSKS